MGIVNGGSSRGLPEERHTAAAGTVLGAVDLGIAEVMGGDIVEAEVDLGIPEVGVDLGTLEEEVVHNVGGEVDWDTAEAVDHMVAGTVQGAHWGIAVPVGHKVVDTAPEEEEEEPQ